MRDDRDEFIDRVVDELKALPPVPADATARVLARVEAARRGGSDGASVHDAGDDVTYFPAASDESKAVPAVGRPVPDPASPHGARTGGGLRRRFIVSFPAAVGYALAATLAGFLIRGAMPRSSTSTTVAQVPTDHVDDSMLAPSAPSVTPVSSSLSREAQENPVPVQLVLDARRATSVVAVGDFNGWDGRVTPLARDSASGLWSTVVDVRPGRHVYAFLVDGKTWTLDPRAPRAKDPDYGTEQSVMIVGTP